MRNLVLTAALLAALVPAARASSDADCTGDCAATYQPYSDLFKVQWNMDGYRAFLARFKEISQDYYLTASGEAPQAPASRAAWFDLYKGRLPYNPRPWTLAYETFRDEVGGFQRGHERERARAAELRLLTDDHELERRLKEKVEGAFPGEMGRRRFKVSDVIYVYLGAGERDFLLRKREFLEAQRKGKLERKGFGEGSAQRFGGGIVSADVLADASALADSLGVGGKDTLFLTRPAPQPPALPAHQVSAAVLVTPQPAAKREEPPPSDLGTTLVVTVTKAPAKTVTRAPRLTARRGNGRPGRRGAVRRTASRPATRPLPRSSRNAVLNCFDPAQARSAACKAFSRGGAGDRPFTAGSKTGLRLPDFSNPLPNRKACGLINGRWVPCDAFLVQNAAPACNPWKNGRLVLCPAR
jgi:hypothetical protein